MSGSDITCPYCSTEMIPYEAEDVILDACPHCGGVWFDPDELKPFIDSIVAQRADLPPADYSGAGDPIPAEDVEGHEMVCPRCVTLLEKFNYGYDSNILLDRCPDCGGLWAEQEAVRELASFMKGDGPADRLHTAMAGFFAAHHSFKTSVRDNMIVTQATSGMGNPLLNSGLVANKAITLSREILQEGPAKGGLMARFPWSAVVLLVVNGAFTAAVFSGVEENGLLSVFGLVPESVRGMEHWSRLLLYFLPHISAILVIVHAFVFWVLSREIVAEIGHARLLLSYVLFGIGAGLLHTFSASHPDSMVVGSAGALAGIAGFCLAWEPRNFISEPARLPLPGVPPMGFLIVWILWLVLFDVLRSLGDSPGEVGWPARIGIFLVGVACGRVFLRVRSLTGST